MSTADLDNPILNSPYDTPEHHFELGPSGPTGELQGRAPPERVVHPHPGHEEGEGGRRAAGHRLRRHGRAAGEEHAHQRHPPRGRAVAGQRLQRRHAHHAASSSLTGPRPPPRRPGAVLPAGGGRDRDLPGRGRRPSRRARLPTPARARERDPQRRPASRRPKMATGTGKTVVMAHAHRLADHQQGRQPPRRAASPSASSSSRPASRSATGSACSTPTTPGQLLRRARPRARRPVGRARSRPRSRSSTTTPSCPATPRRSRASPATPASSCAAASRDADPFRETPDRSPPGCSAPSATRQGRDRRAQRRGPPLLPGQAARATPTTTPTRRTRSATRDARVWFRGLQAVAARPASRRSTTSRPRPST